VLLFDQITGESTMKTKLVVAEIYADQQRYQELERPEDLVKLLSGDLDAGWRVAHVLPFPGSSTNRDKMKCLFVLESAPLDRG
jgi:hypothetical protein